jgi:putative SOS response-associated peptidase YedK
MGGRHVLAQAARNSPHRMPAILAPAAYDAWLSGGAGEACAVLGPYSQDVMACVPGRYASQLTEK